MVFNIGMSEQPKSFIIKNLLKLQLAKLSFSTRLTQRNENLSKGPLQRFIRVNNYKGAINFQRTDVEIAASSGSGVFWKELETAQWIDSAFTR